MPVWAHSQTIVITITDEGFSPREVTVDTSATITFVNKDSIPHWPASNPHPRHDDYSDFDPTHAIAQGDLWTFRPTKEGRWHYHDHLNPHRRGTLVVEAEKDGESVTPTLAASVRPGPSIEANATPLPSSGWWSRIKFGVGNIIAAFRRFVGREPKPEVATLDAAAFQKLTEKEQYTFLEELGRTQGVAAAWAYVETVFTGTNQTSLGGRSHDLAHFVGGLIYKDKGLEGLAVCKPTFAFGCYHGFTESIFADSLNQLLPVAQACEMLGPRSSGPWSSCIHGIGHGVATFFNSTDLTGALAACDPLGEGATFCHDGVFMEFAISAPRDFYKQTELLYPCTAVPLAYQPACGRNLVAALGSRFKVPARDVVRACIAGNAPFTESCVDSFGFAVANELRGSHQLIVARCAELGKEAAAAQCVAAAAGELVFQNYPQWQTEAPAACALVAPSFQAACHARVQQTAQNYSRL